MSDIAADIASRLEDLRQREAAHREKSLRRIDAINKAVTLVLTLAAVGGLTILCANGLEQQLKTSALDCQEACVNVR